jgi:hypothetical protein
MFDWNEGDTLSPYIKLKEGETIELNIRGIKKVEGMYNLKKDNEDLGWHISIETDKGILSVNTWGLYYACRDSQMQEGKTYSINYIKRGSIGHPGQYEIKEVL